MNRRASVVLSILILAIVSGCASAPPATDTVMVWPSPPEEPRIAFVASYRGQSDFKEWSLLDRLFGAPVQDDLVAPFAAVSYQDKLYVTLIKSGLVAIIDPKERKVRMIGDQEPGKLSTPMGIAIDAAGTIFVSDVTRAQVLAFGQDGKIKTFIGKKNEMERPVSISINKGLQRLYVVDTALHKVKVYGTDGHPMFDFGARGDKDGDFNYPTGIEVDQGSGDVIVADSQNHRIQIFSKDGKFKMTFGQAGDGAGSFGMPKSVGIDTEGHLYVVDGILVNVQIFNPDGQVLMRIKGNAYGREGFATPGDIYVDENDRIYLADQMNNRVQVYQYLSEKWKKAHPEEYRKYVSFGEPEKSAPLKVEEKKDK